MPWGYLSDRIGRRPVLLIGPLGMTLSILFFGASARFSSLVVWRFFQGVFNGCIGGYIAFIFGNQILTRLYRSRAKYDSRGTRKLFIQFPLL